MDKVTEGMQEWLNDQPVVQKWLPEMKPETIADGIYENMPFEVYQSIDAWNSSRIKDLVDSKGNSTAGDFYAKHIHKVFSVRLKEIEDQAHFVVGRKIHERTLFGAWDCRTDPEVFNNKNQKGRDAFRNVEMCAASLLARPTFQNYLSGAYREVVIVVTCPITGLRLKAMIDILDSDLQNVIDIKSTANMADLVADVEWKSTFTKYGYPMQQAHYLQVVNIACGEPLFGAVRKMVFAAVEKGKNYSVKFIERDYDKRQNDHDLYIKTLKELALRLKENNWFDTSTII